MSTVRVVAGHGWPALGTATPPGGTGVGRAAKVGWPCPVSTGVIAGEPVARPVDGPGTRLADTVADGSAARTADTESEAAVERPSERGFGTVTEGTANGAAVGDDAELTATQPAQAHGANSALAGSLADFDTPIAREAAAALVAIGRHREPLPKPVQTRVMVVANQKGGVGKTTTTVNMAAALAVSGLKVLVIDMDPQGNASTALSVPHHAEVPSVYDVLVDQRPMEGVVQKVDGFDTLWCVPATIDLAGAEIELVSLVARESRLRQALDAHLGEGGGDYDYVFIDCPPSLGLLTVNALVGGDEVLIPIQCEYYALEGLSQLLRNIDMVRAHLNPDLAVTTILLTMYDARTRLAAQVADEVRTHFGDTVLHTAIPRSVRISEAPSYGQTVMTYDPASSGALSYLEAARELAEQAAGVGLRESRETS